MTTRRERLRAATRQEIKDIARELLTTEGPAAISLRAIARTMGVTPGALYSYFDTRDALVTELVAETYTALGEAVTAAWTPYRDAGDAVQLTVTGLAYREWGLTHPAQFRLLFGDPIPGYRAPEQGPTVVAARAMGGLLLTLVIAAWQRAGEAAPRAGATWDDFAAPFAGFLRADRPDLEPDAVAFFLRFLGRVLGFVTMEVHGHLRALSADPALLFRRELDALLAELGLPAAPDDVLLST